jgi:hypothetical protein
MQPSNTSCTACDNTVFYSVNAHTFLVLLDAWVVAAEAVAASAFWGDGVFSVVTSSLPLLLLLLVPPAGRASEGTATGGGTGAGSVLPPEERGVDVLAQPALPGGITVRDLGFLHPYATTPLSYVSHTIPPCVKTLLCCKAHGCETALQCYRVLVYAVKSFLSCYSQLNPKVHHLIDTILTYEEDYLLGCDAV